MRVGIKYPDLRILCTKDILSQNILSPYPGDKISFDTGSAVLAKARAQIMNGFLWATASARSHGVMVSTLDFESSDPSSSLGGTSFFIFTFTLFLTHFTLFFSTLPFTTPRLFFFLTLFCSCQCWVSVSTNCR